VGRVDLGNLGELVACKNCDRDFVVDSNRYVPEAQVYRPAVETLQLVEELRSALDRMTAERASVAVAVGETRYASAEAKRGASDLEGWTESKEGDLQETHAESARAAESRVAELVATLEKRNAEVAALQRELERIRSATRALQPPDAIVDVALEEWE
jgi:hypothetical protein